LTKLTDTKLTDTEAVERGVSGVYRRVQKQDAKKWRVDVVEDHGKDDEVAQRNNAGAEQGDSLVAEVADVLRYALVRVVHLRD
jgi:hypothetical protein